MGGRVKDWWQYTAAPYGVKVLFTNTAAGLRRLAERFGYEFPTDTLGCVLRPADGPLVVAVLDGNRATLVHECGHAALYVMNTVGINPYSASGEPFCYLLDHMYSHFEKRLA